MQLDLRMERKMDLMKDEMMANTMAIWSEMMGQKSVHKLEVL